jgi:hypothetical protein
MPFGATSDIEYSSSRSVDCRLSFLSPIHPRGLNANSNFRIFGSLDEVIEGKIAL